MKYNISWLLDQINQGQSLKFIYFWGHKSSHDGSIGKTCMSQWWLSEFTVEGITYKSAEHWMMAGKARLFNDNEMLNKVIAAKSPAEAKKLGRKVRGFDHEVWTSNCYEIVTQGNIHKFSQDANLKDYLLTTGQRVLVEASPYDPIWGIGMAQDHRDIYSPEKWRGTNLLGFALMETRNALLNTTD